jgi:hypothetical protein
MRLEFSPLADLDIRSDLMPSASAHCVYLFVADFFRNGAQIAL